MEIKLRALRLSDAESINECIQDEDISRMFLFTRYPYSEEEIEKFIRKSFEDKINVHFAITNEDNEYIGTISLKNINYVDRNAEYAIMIRKEFWGKDVAKKATYEILDYGFNTLNLYKIYLNVLSINVRAIKFYEKVGFKREGIFRDHVYKNGKYVDLVWYSFFKEDFDEMNSL